MREPVTVISPFSVCWPSALSSVVPSGHGVSAVGVQT
jgi:hypothetical protein